MLVTQIEIMRKIEGLYSDILDLTAQIDFDVENHEEILSRRQKILDEIVSLQKQKENLAPGASPQELAAHEKKIKSLILAILSDYDPLMRLAQERSDSIKRELEGAQTAIAAAKAYAAYR